MKTAVCDVLVLLLVGLALMPQAAVALSTGFIENRGQIDAGVKYYVPGEAASVYFTPDAVVLDMKESLEGQAWSDGPMHRTAAAVIDTALGESQRIRGCAIYIHFEGANPLPRIEARGELVTRYHYFLGNDPAKWRSNVPAYSEVVYHDLWPGVDLVYREEEGNLTYEVVSSPGADVGAARFGYDGADQVVAGEDGSLVIQTSVGSIVDLRSLSDMSRGRLLLAREGSQRLGAPAGDRDNPAALLWSTFLGGSDYESDFGWLALDSLGNAVVTGNTFSPDFPTTPGAYDETHNGDTDVFVAKVSSAGSALLWSTFLGGGVGDRGISLALDASGNAVVTGQTSCADFPTTPGAYDQTFNGIADGFVAKVSSTGSALLWSTFLGGTRVELAGCVALDPLGNAVVGGTTQSTNFPTTPGAYDQTHNGLRDVFVAALSSTGSALLWSTFLGGTGLEETYSASLDSSGNVVVTGATGSSNFPTTPGAYDETYNGGTDVFVATLSSTGSALLWSTFLGGSDYDYAWILALDPSGDAVVTGYTLSSDFPTTPGAYDETHNGLSDAFVAKVSSTGAALLWSTFLGGSGDDGSGIIALDASGNAVVGNYTGSSDFPTTPGAYDQTYNGGTTDGFVAKVSSTGSALLWSTFLGGTGDDYVGFVALDPSGNAVVLGMTNSSDFPTTPGAYDQSYNGGDLDVFVAKLGQMATDVASGSSGPRFMGLWPALPNPFCQATEIRYSLKQEAEVDLAVFDVTGRRVMTLARGFMPPGDHRVSWDGQDERGERVESGIYFVRCEVGGSTYYSRIVRVR